MQEIVQRLHIDPLDACREIEDLIHNTMNRLRRDGAVVSLSGGLDSAVAATLTVRSLGTDRVHLLHMPERESKRIHRNHAKRMAAHLGIPLTTQSISPLLRASHTYRLLPLRFLPGRKLRAWVVRAVRSRLLKQEDVLATRLQPEADSWVAKGVAYAMTKHRFRMVLVYRYAEARNLMVVGAANRTEWLTGTFSKWGVDHCADVIPLVHLYRSQLESIAETIGVPDYVRDKPADPDVMPGIDDKGALLGGFDTADQILYGVERGVSKDDLVRAYGREKVEKIVNMWEMSKNMRESPYQVHV